MTRSVFFSVLAISFIFSILTSTIVNANGFTPKDVPLGLSAKDEQKIVLENAKQKDLFLRKKDKRFQTSLNDGSRPFVEYEDSGYLIFSSDYGFSSQEIKKTLAKNLPKDVTLVVYTYNNSESEKNRIIREYSDVIDVSQIQVMYIEKAGGTGFWSRDGVPVPILKPDNKLKVIDARYYHNFEPDAQFAARFGVELKSHAYYYEGGNYMPSKNGVCLIVNNSRVQQIPDLIFTEHYACKKIIRLPHLKGIGHADESVKFIDDKLVLTDLIEYKNILEKEGYEVRMLPRPNGSYETYVNSLLINGVLYLPVFGQTKDAEAIATYQALGFKVVPINTSYLSNNGRGSIHCITMNYPKIPIKTLLETMGGQLL